MAMSSCDKSSQSRFPRALLTLFFALLFSAGATSRVLPGDTIGTQTACLTWIQTGNQKAASSQRRILQGNDWSQPSSGPVDVTRAYKVLAKYVTVDIAGLLLRMAFHDAGTYDKGSDDGGANGSLKYELDR